MRISRYAMFVAGCLAASAYVVKAAPADDKPAPQDNQNDARQDSGDEFQRFFKEGPLRRFNFRPVRGELRKGAYLGLSTSPAPRSLQTQLGLPEGMGLVVDFVAPKSPAAAAGVKQYDVLQRLDDQLLVNGEQLAVLVRSHKPGDEVKLTVIREGKPQTLSAKLAEHELEPLQEFWDFGGAMPPDRALPPPGPGAPARSPFGQWLFRGPRRGAALTWIDGDRTYTIQDRAGHRYLTVKGPNDQTLFEGPIDTPQQRDRIPTDMRDKVEKMLKDAPAPAGKPKPGADPGDQPTPPQQQEE